MKFIAITDFEDGNPQVIISAAQHEIVSADEARQYALQLLATAERAESLSEIFPTLVTINGYDDASKIAGTLRRKLKSKVQ